MAKTKPISDALQVGTKLRLSNGTEWDIRAACKLRDLEQVMSLYDTLTSSPMKFAALFMPQNKEARDAMFQIIHIMSDRKLDDEALLDNLTTADEAEVYHAINRFLGLLPASTGKEEVEA